MSYSSIPPISKLSEIYLSFLALTTDEIAAQCVAYLMAGFDTISNTMGFLFHELAVNPDVQMQLHREVETIRTELDGQPLNYVTLQKLNYLDMVVSESMRRWSTVPFSDRICTKSYTLETNDGTHVQLNPGDSILIPVYALQMDEKYFKNAKKFDPERFASENRTRIHPGTYMPFGLGQREFEFEFFTPKICVSLNFVSFFSPFFPVCAHCGSCQRYIGACIASRFALVIVKTLTFYILCDFIIDKCDKTQDPLMLKSDSFVNDAKKGYFIELRRRKL